MRGRECGRNAMKYVYRDESGYETSQAASQGREPLVTVRSDKVYQAGEKRGPAGDLIDNNEFVLRMRAVANATKAVEGRDSECGGEIPV